MLKAGAAHFLKFDKEISDLYEERVSKQSGDINQAFSDLFYQLSQDAYFQSCNDFQLIPYGSSMNGVLDGDRDQGDLDMTLILLPSELTMEEVDPTFTLEKVKTILSKCRYQGEKQYPLNRIEILATQRVVILKAFDRKNQVNLDLCVNKNFEVFNSKLLHTYC